MYFRINPQEQSALKGLPHLARLTYLEAIRPYMDYATGIVGIKRGISYQSLREELYVEPHTGYTQSGSPSKQQLRRAIQTLARSGLISIQSNDKKLILKCELALQENCGQNKPGTNPTYKAGTNTARENNYQTRHYDTNTQKPDIANTVQPGIPLVSDINNIFLSDAFEKFWQLYPVKFSKQKAWEAFQMLTPSDDLFQKIMAALNKQCAYRAEAAKHGQWMPNWKNAVNWLTQACWQDELPAQILPAEKIGESNATRQRHIDAKPNTTNALWEYCKDAVSCSEESSTNTGASNNIFSIDKYKQKQRAY
ncbi:MAG: hypothetical protein A3C44_00715 [Gammaproteobacteria bacterium RIFCSPHIGHO2_02_FULL_39_13]|nr:MAG: hypothetical protein A3C44_00715 [Gammaproteobacteria bacterium RIFCSPHIGHO2_02_FULL_39_13]OGT49891.1 MAG: hypothetical protein A3E53_02920 [Gammaproteobacteria bacterium RIFCSPHIGHO2_12_FULL_39_24]